MHKRVRVSWLVTGVVLASILCGLGAAIFMQRPLLDWLRLHNYQPPAAISALAANDTMNNYSTKVFYVNHPALQGKTDFSSTCPSSKKEQTIVLGCYHSNQQGISLLSVTDVRLHGIEQVTAAHEMLHAAYDRLSSKDRAYVNQLLQDYYTHDLADTRIRSTIDAYKKTEPTQVVNEMHSIFGTEVSVLPAALEAYYRRYFDNRAKVVEYALHYQDAFTSRQAQLDQIDAHMDQLKQQFTANQDNLDQMRADITASRQQLDAYKNAGNIAAYNAGVPGFNAKINTYNVLVTQTKALIDQYNQLVVQHNSLVFEEQQLVQAVGASVTPIQQ